MINKGVLIVFLFHSLIGFSQTGNPPKIGDSLHKDPFLNTVEQSLDIFYKSYGAKVNTDSI